MWGTTIEDLKANLDKIALGVHDSDEELDSSGNETDSVTPVRHISDKFFHLKSPFQLSYANVFDNSYGSEIEGYKAEIKRLSESEAQMKELWVNYANLLKDKDMDNDEESVASLIATQGENIKVVYTRCWQLYLDILELRRILKDESEGDQISRLNEANNTLTQNLNSMSISNPAKTTGVAFNGPNYFREIADLRAEKVSSDLQIKQLKSELGYKCDKLAALQLKLDEECELNGSIRAELQSASVEINVTSTELEKLKTELNDKNLEVTLLQQNFYQKDNRVADGDIDILKKTIETLENENANLKVTKTAEKAAEIEELYLIRTKLEKELNETKQGKEKAMHELSRLKKHLLDKESEDSEKMDEDSETIHELEANNEHQRTHILHLERTLRQAMSEKEEAQMIHEKELHKSKDDINGMQKKLANFVKVVDAKDVELLNLQAALGQYYAEIEAKDNLEKGLNLARNRLAKLHEELKEAKAMVDSVEKEKEETSAKLARGERVTEEARNRVLKVEEDNLKLRQALEQSMARLNRMSMDSDYFVDRRIVIKLLVTYFQRNHSKEVLDLMVRMLGFSEEEKQRIGVSQQHAGGGVVRGVFGFPGRLVGGILGGSSTEATPSTQPVNPSFSDLWVDFLLKETEEREKREKNARVEIPNGRKPPTETYTAAAPHSTIFSSSRPPPVRGTHPSSLLVPRPDSEFSTVPLTPAGGILGSSHLNPIT